MKKFLKISLLSIGIFLILIFSTYILIIINASKYKIDEKKLVNVDHSTVFLDSNGNELFSTSEGKEVAQFEEISDNVKNAFIAIEDKRFYSHKGVDYKALLRATLNNIKSFSFKEGGSTITQQLIKNTHLTNDKNIKRKIIEISLAKKLEKRYSKNEILEKYLNTVFFGENCYGIASASSHYFNKTPNELSVSESALLAGIVKAPSYYSINNNYDKTIERRNVVLKEMFNQNYITKEEYNFAKKEKIKVSSKKYDFFSLERILTAEVEKNNRLLPYTKNVIKTTINKYLQNNTQEIISNHNEQYDYTAVIIDKEFNVCAYASTCIIPLRQLGSTIKPLLVYGPAIENNVISPASIFLDEKTNFNGYSPSNFNDKYYGNVSAREALTKSLNVPFVKLINMVGIEKSAEYLKKMDFSIIDEDLTLPLSLGAKSKGETLLTIANAYTTFINNGYFKKYNLIENNNSKAISTKIFSEDTNYLVNDALNECAKSGTAKKLGQINKNLCAKTGTVGNKSGNTDAYCISYNTEYCVAVWCGQKSTNMVGNKLNGGGISADVASKIWRNLYTKNNYPDFFKRPKSVIEINLDKESYEKDNLIEISDNNAPLRNVFSSLFRTNNTPNKTSNRFSNPKIEKPILSVNNNEINIRLCLPQYFDAKIFKYKNDMLISTVDTKNLKNKNEFIDTVTDDNIYYYKVVPYYFDGKQTYFGEKIILDKIKLPTKNAGNNWWIDDL